MHRTFRVGHLSAIPVCAVTAEVASQQTAAIARRSFFIGFQIWECKLHAALRAVTSLTLPPKPIVSRYRLRRRISTYFDAAQKITGEEKQGGLR
jgi:hypothetical protein